MNFIWEKSTVTLASTIVQASFLVLLYAFCCFVMLGIGKRKTMIAMFFSVLAVSIFAFLFDFLYLFIGSNFAILTIVFFTLLINIGDARKFIANPFHKENGKKGKVTVERIVNKKGLYTAIEKAAEFLSQHRMGAIITLEKSVSLNDVAGNGVTINAPVTPELLETIFYPGTRLHDGAVIIRDDQVYKAAVFYTPSTKVLTGKYGSRHRAAIGVSEISDSVTIVVSEETGRISIAADGELESVDLNDLVKVLTNRMSR